MSEIHAAWPSSSNVGHSKFKHVILTRFNVRFADKPDGTSLGTDKAWLADRFTLFERYCLPSIQSQSVQNFLWLLFFDCQTPEPFAERARGIGQINSNYLPVFCESLTIEDLKRFIARSLLDMPEWLLTTRLDNDDGLHPNFAASVQKAQSFTTAEVLNCPIGIILAGSRAYRRRDPSNAFISLSEPFDDFKTVLSIPRHVYAREHYPVNQVVATPMWLQVIHSNNISNRVRGWRITMSAAARQYPALATFGVSGRENVLRILAENLTLSLARSARDILVIVARRTARAFGIDLRRKARMPRGRIRETETA